MKAEVEMKLTKRKPILNKFTQKRYKFLQIMKCCQSSTGIHLLDVRNTKRIGLKREKHGFSFLFSL